VEKDAFGGDGSGEMVSTIESIETIAIRVPLDRVYSGSYYRMRSRCTIITRVRTSDGVVGESYNADADEEQMEIVSIIQDELGPRLIGKPALNIEAAWSAMFDATFDQLRDRRLPMQAIACIDSALWDGLGKAVGQPLYRLWGGFRDQMPVIGIGGYYGIDDQGLRDEAEFFLDQGFAGMKFKVGGRSPAEDARRVQVVRDYVGPDFILLCDANQGYTTREAIEFARLTEEVDLRWFEEPCIWYNDVRAMRDVRLATGVPVAAGQSELSGAGMRDLMTSGSIDVSNFDASWGGGPTEWRRVAGMASLFGVEMAHHEEPQVALHLLASIPHATFVEVFTPARDPIFWNLLANRPEATMQAFPLSDAPGFGWELDEAYIHKHKAV
jgi:D-galactarolactone cycloisomerase